MKRPLTLVGTIFESFLLLDDKRTANSSYSLEAVLFSLLVGVLCGGDGFVQAEAIARQYKPFIKKYVTLSRDVPSHDTMARVLALIDPQQFSDAFSTFMERLTGFSRRDIYNLDGKTLRGVVGVGALKRSRSDAALHQLQIVSLFSTMRNVVLAQVKTMKSVNEVKSAQELLQLFDIRNTIVTMDAMHCTRRTLEIIAEQGADAIVTVKRNAPALDDVITETIRRQKPIVITTTERGRGGRRERRTYRVYEASLSTYPTIKSVIVVTRENVSHSGPQKKANVTRYASTLPHIDAKLIADCIRRRWTIENTFHYTLDVTFGEDRSRVREKNAAENLSRVRHLAFNLLSLVKTKEKVSFAMKRIKCAMDPAFLARVLRLPS